MSSVALLGHDGATDVPGSVAGRSVVMFALHRGGSSITARLLQLVLDAAGYRLVDEARRYYQAGYALDDIPSAFFATLAPTGVLYGPFRSYPQTMRLANLAPLARLLIVRDPRDCLVSTFYAQRGPHDRMDLRRGLTRLPTQLDDADDIDDFCVRAADTVRRHLDGMRLLCLHYPDTLVYRYEDIFADPCGWLCGVVARLGLSVPAEAFDQARLEAVFDADGEDAARHHRQGHPGDHHRKLSRRTAMYLAEFFAAQLAFFGYTGARTGADSAPPRSAASDPDDIAALKRIILDLQRENGFRIEELAALRHAVAQLQARLPAPDETP